MRDVTGVEDSGFGGFAQTIVAMREDVSQRAQHHAVISEKCFDAADRSWVVEVEFVTRIICCAGCDPVATALGTDLFNPTVAAHDPNHARHRQKRL